MTQQTEDTPLVTVFLVIVAALVVVPMLFMGFGMMGFGPMMGGMWGGMWGDGAVSGWLFAVGIVIQLLFLVAVVGAGYLIYRAVAGRERGSDRALEELRLAYARGDLTDDEYDQRRERLERDTSAREREE
ncbi:SHOCT domain-containing protein [Haloparvum sedimenti]|uniref:SHOCT domain-containing protein n=1 Tax=Haloparvum sedimenti TaxID=1678448 RepID=UPI00071E8F7C|nr:SHOCT domain-containing protein [Haloparvum sedimenti]